MEGQLCHRRRNGRVKRKEERRQCDGCSKCDEVLLVGTVFESLIVTWSVFQGALVRLVSCNSSGFIVGSPSPRFSLLLPLLVAFVDKGRITIVVVVAFKWIFKDCCTQMKNGKKDYIMFSSANILFIKKIIREVFEEIVVHCIRRDWESVLQVLGRPGGQRLGQ